MKLKCVGVCCGRREWPLFIVERGEGIPIDGNNLPPSYRHATDLLVLVTSSSTIL